VSWREVFIAFDADGLADFAIGAVQQYFKDAVTD
jgi:hypothetical protein